MKVNGRTDGPSGQPENIMPPIPRYFCHADVQCSSSRAEVSVS